MSLTELVIMPGADYQAACDAIRSKTGAGDLIKSGQLPENIEAVYTAGGHAKLHIGQVRGSGTASITVEVPFKPDYVFILPSDPYSALTPMSFVTFYRDFRTFCRIGGWETHLNNEKNYYSNAFNNKSVENYIRYEDGKVQFLPPAAISGYVWREESLFTAVAFHYTDLTDAELLKDYVRSLSDSGGTVTISARRFAETGMTDAEFRAFAAAEKPKWTFVME